MNNDLQELDKNQTHQEHLEQNTSEQSGQEPDSHEEAKSDFSKEETINSTEEVKKEAKSKPNKTETKTAYQFPPIPPTHRVGTLTMGFSLIAVGIIAMISIFYPSVDLILVLKLSPIIFIFLGAEILTAHFFHKKERIKFDLLSGIICLFLVFGGFVLAAIPTVWNYVGPNAQFARDQAERDIEDTVYNVLQDQTDIDSLSVDIEPIQLLYSINTDGTFAADHARVYLDISVAGPYADKKEFAESCKRILDKINTLELNIRNIDFYYTDGSNRLTLYLSDRLQFNLDADRLANHVDSTDFHHEVSSEEVEYAASSEESAE